MHVKRQSTQSHHNFFSLWLLSHARALFFALGEFIRSPIASIITTCVIGIAIALPLGFFVVLQNLQIVNATWDANAPTISLYLRTDTTPAQVDSLMQSLRVNSSVSQVTYISPAEGLKTFEKNTPFGDAVKLFQNNPIPGVIVVLPTLHEQNPLAIQSLYLSLKNLPDVDTAQLDMDWVKRLYNIIAVGKKITRALTLLFGFGVILIIGHTLRASLSSHTKEIQVLKLIGATNSYIRRPLLYRGILYGLLGSIIAWIAINLFIFQLQGPISQLAQTYQSPFQLQDISLSEGCATFFMSALLGFVSAFLITTQFLNQQERMD